MCHHGSGPGPADVPRSDRADVRITSVGSRRTTAFAGQLDGSNAAARRAALERKLEELARS